MRLKLLFLLGPLLITGCTSSLAPTSPISTRLSPTELPPASKAPLPTADIAAAEHLSQQLAGALIAEYGLVRNPEQQNYLNQVGAWLALQTEQPHLTWRFGLLNSRQSLAFATPSGQILISQGLLNLLQTEAELAAVLSHEMAHVLGQDHWRRLQPQHASVGFEQAVALYARGLPAVDVHAADTKAAVLLARAGYNPYALFGLLQRLGAQAVDNRIGWLQGNANPAERLKHLALTVGDQLRPFEGGIEQTADFERLLLKPSPSPKLPPPQISPSSSPLPANTIIHPQRIQM